MDIITGNRFLDIADVEFNGSELVTRSTGNQSSDLIIFCETHNLKNFFWMVNKGLVSYSFVLISHNSDGCITSYKWRDFDFQFKESELPANCIAWYAQNMDVLSSRIRPLPIGLENFKWHKGKKWQELTQVAIRTIPRNKMVYMNFEVSTNPSERNMCFNALRSKSFVTRAMTKVSYLEYITAMKQHYFVACPEGNGYDTHRMWEALYLGCIPIVHKRIFTQMFSKIFPMFLIDHWDEDVTMDKLKLFLLYGNFDKYIAKATLFSFWHKVVKGSIKIS